MLCCAVLCCVALRCVALWCAGCVQYSEITVWLWVYLIGHNGDYLSPM